MNTLSGDPLRLYDVKKYFHYFFERKGFTAQTKTGVVSEAAMRAALLARGPERGPAVIMHGIMPRSGTVYVGELLRRHPDLHGYAHQMWEFPALQLAPQLQQLQEEFFNGYRGNRDRLAESDFLTIFGGAMMALVHSDTPQDKRALVKMPSVQFLSHFFTMFPYEHSLVLVRDGRDVVHSTLRTWRYLNFVQVCLRWNRSAQSVLANQQQMTAEGRRGYLLARFEDALADPEAFIRRLCAHFDLDPDNYPYEEVTGIPVIGSSKLAKDKVTWQHVRPPQNFKPKDYWRKWSPLKKAVFKAIAGQSLLALGYGEDLKW